MSQRNIFMAFLRCGLLGYGGGPSSIPLVHREVVVTYKWMTDEEFADVVALANTLPGPLATKVAGYIGYRVGGVLGCANALVATVIPTVVLMIGLLTTLARFSEYAWVQGMTRAMIPVVAVMLGTLAFQFLQTAAKSMPRWVVGLHVLAVGALTVFLGVHPAIIIAGLLLWALFGDKIWRKGSPP
ncbi:MAG: chromate transporter [Spirochaetes bacterium]|nr:chromate transporter [Spirochaetota bacterium]